MTAVPDPSGDSETRLPRKSATLVIRDLFAANSLVLVRFEHHTHQRELGYYLNLAGCTGEEAERVRSLSPGDREHYTAESAWYLCVKR